MRLSRDAMARHHEEIVAAASSMLRRSGILGFSVVDLMASVGLTHGGFYRHFASKEILVAEATAAAFKDNRSRLTAAIEAYGPTKAVKGFLEYYLSAEHLNASEEGCPIPAIAGDVAREGTAVRTEFSHGYDRILSDLAAGIEGPPEQRRTRAIELMVLMSGAVMAARATNNPEQAAEILKAARNRARVLIADAS